MRQDRTRLVALIALAAMAVLSLAVPVHHGHMLRLALAGPAPAAGQVAHGAQSGHQAHHLHGRPSDASGKHAAADEQQPGQAMPRCPICSTVQAAAVPVPSLEPELAVADGGEPTPALSVALAVPSALHFRPVQPRAPPIGG